jgi:hypothetical protein
MTDPPPPASSVHLAVRSTSSVPPPVYHDLIPPFLRDCDCGDEDDSASHQLPKPTTEKTRLHPSFTSAPPETSP